MSRSSFDVRVALGFSEWGLRLKFDLSLPSQFSHCSLRTGDLLRRNCCPAKGQRLGLELLSIFQSSLLILFPFIFSSLDQPLIPRQPHEFHPSLHRYLLLLSVLAHLVVILGSPCPDFVVFDLSRQESACRRHILKRFDPLDFFLPQNFF